MPSLKWKRPVLPSHVNLFAVPPGAKRAGQAGAYAPADANVTIHFEGVDSSFFDVIKIETFDLEPVSGGELPPGHTGPPPLELVAALSTDGPGPISVSVDQAVIAVVGFSAPASPTKAAYSATCVMVGDGWSQPVSFAVAASVEAVRVDLLASNITIVQGGRASLPGTITWLAGPKTDVDFLDFAVVDFGIRAESLSVPVLPNQSTPIPFTITLTATTDAPPGTHELFGLEFAAFHGDQTGNFDHRVTVTTLVPAARRLAQVTGTDDFISAGVRGVDMGPSVTHLGTHYVFFGDVPLSGRAEGGRSDPGRRRGGTGAGFFPKRNITGGRPIRPVLRAVYNPEAGWVSTNPGDQTDTHRRVQRRRFCLLFLSAERKSRGSELGGSSLLSNPLC